MILILQLIIVIAILVIKIAIYFSSESQKRIKRNYNKKEIYTKRVIFDLPDVEPEDPTMKDTEVYDEYHRLKFCKPVDKDIPEIDNLPESCNTGITYEECLKLKMILKAYNYKCKELNKDDLMYQLKRFNKKYKDIDSQETKEWVESLKSVINNDGIERAEYIIDKLLWKRERSWCVS